VLIVDSRGKTLEIKKFWPFFVLFFFIFEGLYKVKSQPRPIALPGERSSSDLLAQTIIIVLSKQHRPITTCYSFR
jgi:hypothetical protein